jgi:hypothetical protein
MRWIVDPIKGPLLVDDWVADLCECEVKNRGFGIGASDRQAYSRIHSALPPSANVRVAVAPKVTTVGEPVVKPSGFVEPRPLGPPPGTNLVDRVAKAFEEQDKAAFRRRLKP